MAEPLIVPGQVAREMDVERRVEELARTPTCPAASAGQFADTGRRYIRCTPADDVYVARENIEAVLAFCCGDHTACPVWRMSRENGGAAIAAFRAEMEQHRQDRITREQIERGVRVDDRGLERERAEIQGDAEPTP